MMAWKRIEGTAQLEPAHPDFVTKDFSAQKMIATEDVVFILSGDKKIEVVNAKDIAETIKKTDDKIAGLGPEKKGEAVTFCLVGNEMWVGDSKGFITVFDPETLAPKEDIEPMKTKNGDPCVSIASSLDGSVVAVGDSKGYTTVFDSASRERKLFMANGRNKVLDMQFHSNGTHVISLGFDKYIAVSNVETKATVKIMSK